MNNPEMKQAVNVMLSFSKKARERHIYWRRERAEANHRSLISERDEALAREKKALAREKKARDEEQKAWEKARDERGRAQALMVRKRPGRRKRLDYFGF